MRRILLINRNKPGHFAIVDDRDYYVLTGDKWHYFQGYAKRILSHKTQEKMSDVIMGKPPRGFVWDHENRNRLDNRKKNLRLATRSQNNANRLFKRDKTHKYRGVRIHKHPKRVSWDARIRGYGHIGSFQTPQQAAKAFDRMAFLLHREFAILNFPIRRFPRLEDSNE